MFWTEIYEIVKNEERRKIKTEEWEKSFRNFYLAWNAVNKSEKRGKVLHSINFFNHKFYALKALQIWEEMANKHAHKKGHASFGCGWRIFFWKIWKYF